MHVKQIYNHGLSNNVHSETLRWKLEERKRTKDPKQNPSSDSETNKENFKAMESANNKLKNLLRKLQCINVGSSNTNQ